MRKFFSLAAAAALLAVLVMPASASAHGRFDNWSGPQSGGTHNLTYNETTFICASRLNGIGYHGGVSRWGNTLAFHSAWPYFEELTVGYRAGDGSLMKCTLRENYNYGPSYYNLAANHQ